MNSLHKEGCVYILSNSTNSTLYVGVTSDIKTRLHQHKTNFFPRSFTSRYKCYKLVYYRHFPSIGEAVFVEKRLKGGSRRKKVELIETINPEWDDLYEKVIDGFG